MSEKTGDYFDDVENITEIMKKKWTVYSFSLGNEYLTYNLSFCIGNETLSQKYY